MFVKDAMAPSALITGGFYGEMIAPTRVPDIILEAQLEVSFWCGHILYPSK